MKRFEISLAFSAAAVAVSCFASTASANGRFPRAERLIEHPTDPNKLYIAATYGLQLTTDRGKNWYHVCETAFSFQMGYTGDPVVSLTGNGSLLAGAQSALVLSTDNGCDWKQTLMAPKQAYFDFAVAPSGTHPIVASVTTYEANGTVNTLQESTDNGVTWKTIGTPLPVVVLNTVDVDPTDPTHIYATGLTSSDDTPNTGVFLVSTNHGTTWTSYPIPNTFAWASPYIAAVHPTDGKKIFVRTDAWKDRDNVQTANDALLYSSDGGKTWTEILHPGGPADDSPGAKLFGFAISPDGSTVLAGYGDPVDGSRLVEGMWFGVYKSSTDGKYSFGADIANPTPLLPTEPISCITWTKTGVYVCMVPQGETSFLAFAKDATFTSRNDMTILMKLNETKGVPPSCAGRSTSTCNWSVDCTTLNACTDGGATTTTTSGGGGGAGSTTSGGAGGTTTSGGSGGATGSTTTGTAGATSTSATTGGGVVEKPKSCNCRVPGAPSSTGAQALGALFGAILLGGRRRSRRRAAFRE
jgi:MYXO-CTERM domain-containing protein